MKYKIGDYIKIKTVYDGMEWYHEKIMKIVGYNTNINNYVLDNDYFIVQLKNNVYGRFVFQDKECIKKHRVDKFKRLLKNEI